MKKEKPKRLGIDLGNTLILKVDGQVYVQDGALITIKSLMDRHFGQEVYIVSKVTPAQEVRARAWLERNGFFELLGIPKTHLHFCAERCEKGPICQGLGITHFIDDRPEVFAHMDPSVCRFLFKPRQEDLVEFDGKLPGAHIVAHWSEVESHAAFR